MQSFGVLSGDVVFDKRPSQKYKKHKKLFGDLVGF